MSRQDIIDRYEEELHLLRVSYMDIIQMTELIIAEALEIHDRGLANLNLRLCEELHAYDLSLQPQWLVAWKRAMGWEV